MNKKLIIGLGNPGEKYKNTRHNVGFVFVDALAEDLGISWSFEKKFKADVARNNEYILSKPQTYVNLSGISVKSLVNYFSIKSEHLLIVHDDVDLPVMEYKYHFARGSAGHHGIEDVIEKLGTQDFWRLRIGVGRPQNNKFDVKDFVLSGLSEEELKFITHTLVDLHFEDKI